MTVDFMPGDWVLCQWQGGRFWFPGVVHSVNHALNSVAIQYDDGSSEIRPANQVKAYDWAAGSRIQAVWAGDNKWYPAEIVEIEPGGAALTIRYEDGVVEKTVTARCRSE